MIIQNYMEQTGRMSDLNMLPNATMQADLKKLTEETGIWQIKNDPSNVPKYLFKFHWSKLSQIQSFCNKYQILPQITRAQRQRKIYSTRKNSLYKDFYVKFIESGRIYRGDKGTQFERNIADRITAQAGVPIEAVWASDSIVYDIMSAGGIVKILEPAIMRGDERNKRDIDISNPSEVDSEIGGVISDVDIVGEDIHGERVVLHLSCKQGSVISYINRGVKKEYLSPKEIANEKILNTKGRALLDMLGIKEGSEEEKLFFAIFNRYSQYKNKGEIRSKVVDLTKKVSKAKLSRLISASIGKGYVLVHEVGGKIKVTSVDNKELQKYNEIEKVWADFCLGKKQFNMFCRFTSGKVVKLSFRNTRGLLYPTHFLLYWTKDNKG